MQHTGSADGTPIAFDVVGRGRPVVIVGGAFSTADAGRPLAAALAERDLRGVVMDRRGRGASGDASATSPEREAEDVAAVVTAVGGDAAVLGHSSGAVLALVAAASGLRTAHLFLSEPPFRFGTDEPPADLADRLQTAVDEGRRADAVTLFQREAVGLRPEVIDGIRASPAFEGLLPLAHTTVYDARLAAAFSTPTAAMIGVGSPVTILRGDPTFPVLIAAADRLAAAMPSARLVVVPESRDHGVDPEGTAREVRRRLG